MSRPSITLSVLLAALLGTITACGRDSQPEPSRAQPAAVKIQATQMVEMAVTSEGFVPAEVTVKAGQPVMLMVTRKTDKTCATSIVIKDFGINRPLPLNQAVEITFTPTKPGRFRYACAMDMVSGVLVVE
ncbi:MAG: cupredoxin domain-containing protein [Candidatus Latescibacterota bacterium]|jgi:plastocyanin domain-containing protein